MSTPRSKSKHANIAISYITTFKEFKAAFPDIPTAELFLEQKVILLIKHLSNIPEEIKVLQGIIEGNMRYDLIPIKKNIKTIAIKGIEAVK